MSLQLFSEETLLKLRDDFCNEYPLLADVFKVLFLHAEDNRESNRKQLTVARAVSLLMSLRNKIAHNDAKLEFSIMLIFSGLGLDYLTCFEKWVSQTIGKLLVIF